MGGSKSSRAEPGKPSFICCDMHDGFRFSLIYPQAQNEWNQKKKIHSRISPLPIVYVYEDKGSSIGLPNLKPD
jgi:hypothetical protein